MDTLFETSHLAVTDVKSNTSGPLVLKSDVQTLGSLEVRGTLVANSQTPESFTLPQTRGAVGQILATNGQGETSWSNAPVPSSPPDKIQDSLGTTKVTCETPGTIEAFISSLITAALSIGASDSYLTCDGTSALACQSLGRASLALGGAPKIGFDQTASFVRSPTNNAFLHLSTLSNTLLTTDFSVLVSCAQFQINDYSLPNSNGTVGQVLTVDGPNSSAWQSPIVFNQNLNTDNNVQFESVVTPNVDTPSILLLGTSQATAVSVGNPGITTTIDGTLNVSNAYTLPSSAGTAGQVLTSNGATSTWETTQPLSKIIAPDGESQFTCDNGGLAWLYLNSGLTQYALESNGPLNYTSIYNPMTTSNITVAGSGIFLTTPQMARITGTSSLQLQTYFMPNTSGSPNQVLTTDGASNAYWRNSTGFWQGFGGQPADNQFFILNGTITAPGAGNNTPGARMIAPRDCSLTGVSVDGVAAGITLKFYVQSVDTTRSITTLAAASFEPIAPPIALSTGQLFSIQALGATLGAVVSCNFV